VFDKYADSSLADDALFRAGEAAEKLKNCTEARAYFGLIKSKYPKSNLAKKAGEKDKALKSAAKDKKKCTS
jgi:TolA-binding protein